MVDARMSTSNAPMALERIEDRIVFIRSEKVLLDRDLALIYGTATKRLNEQVKRNVRRFPEDFMFRLTRDEVQFLRSHIATSSHRQGGRRSLPYAFTEHGAIMVASVLNTDIAVAASIQVVRAFVRLRRLVAANADLARKLDALEKRYDSQFKVVFDALRALMSPPGRTARRIGFRPSDS
jgi:hypothetical protein